MKHLERDVLQITKGHGMSPKKPLLLAGFISAAGLVASACGSSSSSTTTTSATTSAPATTQAPTTTAAPNYAATEIPPTANVSLQETGSTLLYPLFNLWAPDYSKAYPNITITTGGTGSGTGIADAANGTVDIGASDAYLSTTQTTKTPTLLNIPLAISAQEIVYNIPGVTQQLDLTGQIISRIYQGKVQYWDDASIKAINPSVALPHLLISPVHRSDGSGDTFIFTQYLSKQDPAGWGATVSYGTTVAFPTVSSALGANGNGGMVTTCGVTKGCIAYVGVSFASAAQKAGLTIAAISNEAGKFVTPSAASIQAEAQSFIAQVPTNEAISLIDGPGDAAYPIINFEYAIVNSAQTDPNKAQAIRSLLTWAIDPAHGNATSYISQVNFQALPQSVAALSLAQINKVQAG